MDAATIDSTNDSGIDHTHEARARLLEHALVNMGTSMLIVDSSGLILEAFGPVASAINARPGQQRWRALDVLPTGLCEPTAAALAQAAETGKNVIVEGVTFDHEYVHTTDVSVSAMDISTLHFTVVFPKWRATAVPTAVRDRPDSTVRSRLSKLQDEVESLRATVQRSQAARVSLEKQGESMSSEIAALNNELLELSTRLRLSVEHVEVLSADLDELLGTIPLGILVTDADGIVRRFNDAIASALSIDGLKVGHTIAAFKHGLRDVDLEKDVIRAVQAQVGYEREVRTRSDEVLLMIIEPFIRNDGAAGVVVTTGDITRSHHAHARLSTFAHAFEQSPWPQLFAEATGRVIEANPAFYEFTGMPRAEVETADVRSLVAGVTAPEQGRSFFDALDYGDRWNGVLSFKRGMGDPIESHTHVTPLRSSGSRISEFVVTLTATREKP